MSRAVIILLILSCSRSAAGQALEQRPAGSSGLALAGAGASSLRGPTAIWVNPALLPLVGSRHLTLELGLMDDARQLTVSKEVNQSIPARDLDVVHLAPAIALAHQLGVPWLWGGVGYRIARQVHSRYPGQEVDTQGQVTRPAPARHLGTALTLEQHVVSLAVGVRCRRAALGASLELSHVRLTHRRDLWAGAASDIARIDDSTLDLNAQLDARSTINAGAVFGAWTRLLSWAELGASIRLPVTAGLDGTVQLTPGSRPPSTATALEARSGQARIDLQLPLEVQAGVTLGPVRWRLLLEAGYQRWSAADAPVASLSDTALIVTSSTGQREQPLERLPLGIGLRDSFSTHVGVELAPWGEVLVVRTGYSYHYGASVERQPSPVLLDLNRHVWGLGVQTKLSWLTLGAAFAHSFEACLDVGQNQAPIVNPLYPEITALTGAGQYRSSRLQISFEAGASW